MLNPFTLSSWDSIKSLCNESFHPAQKLSQECQECREWGIYVKYGDDSFVSCMVLFSAVPICVNHKLHNNTDSCISRFYPPYNPGEAIPALLTYHHPAPHPPFYLPLLLVFPTIYRVTFSSCSTPFSAIQTSIASCISQFYPEPWRKLAQHCSSITLPQPTHFSLLTSVTTISNY